MSKRRTKLLRSQLIEILGKSPTPEQWRRWKRMCGRGEIKLSSQKKEEIRKAMLENFRMIAKEPPTTFGIKKMPVSAAIRVDEKSTDFAPYVPKKAETRRSLWLQFLIWFGIRSRCCGAKTQYNQGYDRTYCSECGGKV